jgi:hypothetical protein
MTKVAQKSGGRRVASGVRWIAKCSVRHTLRLRRITDQAAMRHEKAAEKIRAPLIDFERSA